MGALALSAPAWGEHSSNLAAMWRMPRLPRAITNGNCWNCNGARGNRNPRQAAILRPERSGDVCLIFRAILRIVFRSPSISTVEIHRPLILRVKRPAFRIQKPDKCAEHARNMNAQVNRYTCADRSHENKEPPHEEHISWRLFHLLLYLPHCHLKIVHS